MRRIFHSVVAGESIASIARALRAEKIPIPSEHWKRIGAPVRAAKYTDPYAWSTTTISYILKRPEYTGRKVLGKTVCENYKTKSTRKTAPEEQYIFDGEIPAIVDEETWNTVQRLMGTKRRAPKRQTTPNRLTGLLYCADCGAKLTHRSSLVQGKYLDDAFVCSSYRQLTRDCTMHYIPTAKMEAAILVCHLYVHSGQPPRSVPVLRICEQVHRQPSHRLGDSAEYLTDERFNALITEAEKYLGYPYVWGGSSPSTSFDCSGFVSYVLTNSGLCNTGRLGAQGLYNISTPVSDPQPGDLVFFVGTYDTSGVSHVGIYVGDGMMLHCGDPIQYSNLNTSYWQSHFYAYGRPPYN